MSITKMLISKFNKYHPQGQDLAGKSDARKKQLLKIFSDFSWIAGNNCYLCQSMKQNSVILHHHHPIS